MFDESLLKRCECAGRAQALHGRDLAVLVLDGQGEAGIDALAINEHGAGPAGALVAALLRARQMKMVAQQVEQGCSRIDVDIDGRSVDKGTACRAPGLKFLFIPVRKRRDGRSVHIRTKCAISGAVAVGTMTGANAIREGFRRSSPIATLEAMAKNGQATFFFRTPTTSAGR